MSHVVVVIWSIDVYAEMRRRKLVLFFFFSSSSIVHDVDVDTFSFLLPFSLREGTMYARSFATTVHRASLGGLF